MFDISKLGVNPTATIELENPNGEALINDASEVMSITIYGPGSKQFIAATANKNHLVYEHIRKGGKKLKRGEERELDAEFLAACTVSFNGFGYGDLTGHEMFKAAYMDIAIGFINDQVNKAIGDWSNFTKGSGKN